jgi:hypothetical protein
VQILWVLVFAFYKEQLAALAELSFRICAPLVMRYVISRQLISQSLCDAPSPNAGQVLPST